MRILITGGAGFIGSHLVLQWMEARPEDKVVNLDKLTYAADLKFLEPVSDRPSYRFVKADLADRKAVSAIVREFRPQGVLHLAAESHVDNSIKDPSAFIHSNIVGTFNLLEECRELWGEEKNRFLHVSTDEVYGELGETGAFTETTPYAPNSPYSASKASSDHLVHAFQHTYGMNTVITNCSNNFGPHQHDEKLIPTVIRSALQHKPIPVYGKGENTRDWLYVGDHCRALREVFAKGRAGECYNIGANNEWKNLDLVKKICQILNQSVGKGPNGDYASLIEFVTDRPGHDFRYAIDASKIVSEIGWKPERDFETDLERTVSWFAERYSS